MDEVRGANGRRIDPNASDRATLIATVATLYEAAGGLRTWGEAVEGVLHAVDAERGGIVEVRLNPPGLRVLHGRRIDAPGGAVRLDTRHPFDTPALRSATVGALWSAADLIGPEAPRGAMVSLLQTAPDHMVLFEIYFSERVEDVSAGVLARLQLLLSPLVRAWRLGASVRFPRRTPTHEARLPAEPTGLDLRVRYNFTRAEVRICEDLRAGLPLRAIARKNAVSLNTVRSHLQNAFAKTGVNRQAALIRLLMGAEVEPDAAAEPEPTRRAL